MRCEPPETSPPIQLLATAKVGISLFFFSALAGTLSLFADHELLLRWLFSCACVAISRASEFLRDYDGSVIQMRMAYSAVAHFLVQWTDCKLAGALGLLKVMLYKVYADGSSAALPDWEREASIREFYGIIFPSLLQLPSGITELDERKQRRLCLKKFRGRDEQLSEVDTERELECGICLEVNRKVVLPDCAHTLCMRCYEDWNAKSKSCPFCRACLEEVKPGSLWMYTDDSDVVDMDTLTRENIRRLFMYINKLPLVILHVVDLDLYEYRIK
ncbi:unnamed protein product [Urochloa decumbens]|uniref:RING-type domain-containing protein n=1 Tax=Urochloa decumbens TaxID=240449 RepID=A0ABC8XZ10_9POAL